MSTLVFRHLFANILVGAPPPAVFYWKDQASEHLLFFLDSDKAEQAFLIGPLAERLGYEGGGGGGTESVGVSRVEV